MTTATMRELLVADYSKCLAIAVAITREHAERSGRGGGFSQGAMDVVADAHVSALEQIEAETVSFENAGRFYAWLRRIVRRTAARAARNPQGINAPRGKKDSSDPKAKYKSYKYSAYNEDLYTSKNVQVSDTAFGTPKSSSSLHVHTPGRVWGKATVPAGASPDC